MSLKLGIVGLPNAGKSTIFNALTAAGVEVAPYPFTTINPHQGISSVPDERLAEIARLIQPQKVTPATLEVWDIAGLVKGASKGEGLGNQFLGHIRSVDALIHVVRCFEDQNVVAGEGTVDPVRDIDTVNTELLLADLEVLSRQISKMSKLAKVGDHTAREEAEALREIEAGLNKGIPARHLKEAERHHLQDIQLLTAKPVLYVANVSEGELSARSTHQEAVMHHAGAENAPVVAICGKLEAELEDLGETERKEFLREYGLAYSGLETLVHEGYRLLAFITFYTVVSKELRAWTLIQGTKAPQAAGKIHSDMERGFIKAEVISFNDFVACGSLHHAREKGLIALEGRDYEVRDGDIVTFRFNT
jgi:ribosome-binding ATPase